MSVLKVVHTGMLWFPISKETLDLKSHYTYVHPKDPDQNFETFVELPHKQLIGLPAGDITKIRKLAPPFTIEDRRVATPVDKPFEFTLGLRDYQETTQSEIFQFIEQGGTTFNLSGAVASGKSITLASILAKLGVKTLILANLSMLTEQLFKEFQDNTTADVTLLNAQNMDLADINIATSQFISRHPELWYQIKKHIGCIVVDEAHGIMSKSMMRIIQRAYAKYHIFVSATFSRSVDGRTQGLLDFAGPTKFELVNAKNLIPNIYMVRCSEQFPHIVNKREYARAKKRFYRQTSIDDKVILITNASLKKNRQVLIAVDVIFLQERLQAAIPHSEIINSKTKKADRGAILQRFASGETTTLIAANTVNAGLSVPQISTIIRVSFKSSPEANTQLVGRAVRMFPEKTGAYIFDLVFAGLSSFKRLRAYEENGWNIYNTSWENLKRQLE